jgi:general secretion pathway protein K
MMLYLAIISVADPAKPDPRLYNPVFVAQLIEEIKQARMFSFLGMSVSDFVNLISAAGVPVNQQIKSNVQNNNWVSDKSSTFRIEAVGTAGEVRRKITAVIKLDPNLGQLVYWRED